MTESQVDGTIPVMGEMRRACKTVVGKPEKQRLLKAWEDNIKVDVK